MTGLPAAFSNTASNAKTAIRNPLLGEWHSLVNLIVLGSNAGTLSESQAAGLFRKVCNALAATDHSAQALTHDRVIVDDQDPSLDRGRPGKARTAC